MPRWSTMMLFFCSKTTNFTDKCFSFARLQQSDFPSCTLLLQGVVTSSMSEIVQPIRSNDTSFFQKSAVPYSSKNDGSTIMSSSRRLRSDVFGRSRSSVKFGSVSSWRRSIRSLLPTFPSCNRLSRPIFEVSFGLGLNALWVKIELGLLSSLDYMMQFRLESWKHLRPSRLSVN